MCVHTPNNPSCGASRSSFSPASPPSPVFRPLLLLLARSFLAGGCVAGFIASRHMWCVVCVCASPPSPVFSRWIR
jgi:hypothetical protein